MFKIYYTDPNTDFPHVCTVGELSDALYAAKTYREQGMTFVTMVSENPNSVGKAGVDEIINGACPDGVEYDWNKSSRIGATKRR
jgi:hypothetical protein